jgi:TPR repeat protein
MNRTLQAAVAGLIFAVGFIGPATRAEPFLNLRRSPADIAFLKHDWATAQRLMRPLAEQGDALAQFALGAMYDNGLGVPQDYVIAHMWFNLAAAGGEIGAPKARAGVAEKMTPAQIAEAQELAREWKPK